MLMKVRGGEGETNRFIPVNGHTGAVDVGGIAVLKVFEARVPRFLSMVSKGLAEERDDMTNLSIACLESHMEKASNAILGGSGGIVHDETKPGSG